MYVCMYVCKYPPADGGVLKCESILSQNGGAYEGLWRINKLISPQPVVLWAQNKFLRKAK